MDRPSPRMNPLLGRWRITTAELWRDKDLDVAQGARVEFQIGSTGSIRMGSLEGEIDWRSRDSRAGWRAHFTWSGSVDGRPASGRGWVRLVDQRRLFGKVFIHGGEDPRFRALRI